jgi:protein-disulfide isomerase
MRAPARRRTLARVSSTPLAIPPLDVAVDHVRGRVSGRQIVEYGDYECPYSRAAYRQIERVSRQVSGDLCLAFRHYPLTAIHPHALAASAAAEAASLQGRFWPMHDLLFRRQTALDELDLGRYAAELGLDVAQFDSDRGSGGVQSRIDRDVGSGLASGQVEGTPTLFIDGVVHREGYGAAQLLEALRG